MVFAVDVEDDVVRVWSRDGADAVVERDESYTPSLYVGATDDRLAWLGDRLASDLKVVQTALESRFTSLRADEPETVLRVDVERPSEIDTLAREIRTIHESDDVQPGTFRLFNVDLSPKFRYCLETETRPVPAERLRTLSLALRTRLREQGPNAVDVQW